MRVSHKDLFHVSMAHGKRLAGFRMAPAVSFDFRQAASQKVHKRDTVVAEHLASCNPPDPIRSSHDDNHNKTRANPKAQPE